MKKINSWGNIFKPDSKSLIQKIDLKNFNFDKTILGYGLGRSYGDVCLNRNGIILDTSELDKIIELDEINNILTVEAGATLKSVLAFLLNHNFFLPVVPGTQNVTIGGAIANDIHGKNHHKSGSFGNHLVSFDLLKSDGTILTCSDEVNSELFRATIGGIGLTGIILKAKIKLIKVSNEFIAGEQIKFNSLNEFWKINSKYDEKYEYTVAWIDCLSKKHDNIRGIFIGGNHSKLNNNKKNLKKITLNLPITPPFSFVNNISLKLFNSFYFNFQKNKKFNSMHYKKFFFPLDIINNWNRAYGKKGFYQYQFVIPKNNSKEALYQIVKTIKDQGQVAALGVLKTFGPLEPRGMMSFTREGVTMALDFQNKGKETLKLFKKLDLLITKYGGAIYAAKDSRMSKKMFIKSYPNYQEFLNYKDPKFNSDFFERIFVK